jgi:dihydroxyacetone kinase-like protein
MTTASDAVLQVLSDPAERDASSILGACGAAVAKKAPSTSGTLVATGFLRAAQALQGATGSSIDLLVSAFDAATAGVQGRGKAAVGDRTMLDGLSAACESLRKASDDALSVGDAMRSAAEASGAATRATETMEPRAGRSSWTPERAKGHPDAGCRMVTIALEAAANALTEERRAGPA